MTKKTGLFQHHEFWPSWIVEAPYYIAIAWHSLLHRVSPKGLMKANYQLGHGDIGIDSKYDYQLLFDQKNFPATLLIPSQLSHDEKKDLVLHFLQTEDYPLIFKPDLGFKGLAVVKVKDNQQLERLLPLLTEDYMCQTYVDRPAEYGIFIVRQHGTLTITGIVEKHFPSIVGDGVSTIETLMKSHDRYTQHRTTYEKYHDMTAVITKGEKRMVSFIGSHTMGSVFTDSSYLITPLLLEKITKLCSSVPGFNFGRLDIKSPSAEALQQGEMSIIEINGLLSQPTWMFDPSYSWGKMFRIYLHHAKLLVKVASEHKKQEQKIAPALEIIRRMNTITHTTIPALHEKMKAFS